MSNPDSHRDFAVAAVRKLRQAGFDALFAGGCVRDQLLGKDPKDYDVATNARPEQVRQVFGKRQTIAIGAAFGVIAVLDDHREVQLDVATFRCDAGYSDGRRPDSVTYSNAEEDAKRRDFTINGMFYDPLEDKVIDYVGGLQDMENRLIRAIGDPHARIAEDKLRMLRAVRFASTYGFTFAEGTLRAVTAHAQELPVVSAERIAAEVKKMLAHPKRQLAIQYLNDTNLLQPVFNDESLFEASRASDAIRLVGELKTERFEAAFAAVLMSLFCFDYEESFLEHRKQVSRWTKKWKLSNDESALVLWMLESLPCILSANEMVWPQVQPILIHPEVNELLALAKAVEGVSDDVDDAGIRFCEQKLALPSAQLNPPPLISGDELRSAGLKPGPNFSKLLKTIRDRQLMGEISSSEDALQLAIVMSKE